MASKDMSAPFGLALAGGIITLIISVIYGLILMWIGLAAGAIAGIVGAEALSAATIGLTVAMMIWGIITGIVVIVGALMMRKPSKAHTGSIIVLVFGILSFFTPGFGLVVGPILTIIGGALGLSKKHK